MSQTQGAYYVPHGSPWPIVGSVSLTLIVLGGVNLIQSKGDSGLILFGLGAIVLTVMLFGWFGAVINESIAGSYNEQVDRSFRISMAWFIFSEVMFFAAFFGTLFYARVLSVPWLGGEGDGAWTNALLWPGFESIWPSNGPENVGGAFDTIGAWGIPAINTAILLTSGVTITWAHHALKADKRLQLIVGLAATVALGFYFLYLQVAEYIHAYQDLNLTLNSGIFGSTFFMLTGFHGFHVTLGALMLTIILLRCIRGHFSSNDHFAFEAVAWYWHFVDVVWLGLFVVVYWI